MSMLIRCRNYARILLLSLFCIMAADIGAGGAYAATANSQYSLEGAKYQLYTDSACTEKAKTADGSNAVLTTDENGDSEVLEMAPGTYYAREIKASRGYRLDTDEDGGAKVYTIEVTASDTESDPATFTSCEPPVYGVPDFMVIKTDPKGAFDCTKLVGAKFTVKYYDVATREEIADAEPKDQWTFTTVKQKTAKGTDVAGFDWQSDEPVSYSHEGNGAFYEVSEDGGTKRVLPLGWFTVEETEAPPGFWLSDRVCYGHIYQPEEGAEAVTEIEGTSEDRGLKKDTLVFVNQPYPSISTTASAQENNHEVKDIITYENLVPDENYVLRGWLVDTLTGEKVPGSDGSVRLKAGAETDGQVEMVLSTDGYAGMEGYSLTAFEELYLVQKENGKEKELKVAEHKDINDGSQTVEIYQDLKIKKKVTGNLGDLSKVFEYTVSFTGLVPGKSYTVEGFDGKVFNADQSGNAVIPLKLTDDRSVTIKKLPKGAKYQVTEASSDHEAGFRVFSEDMADKGAEIVQASGSNAEDVSKDLSTALETVDLFDGTVVIAWENNRDLAALTGIAGPDYKVYAAALAAFAVIALALAGRRREYTEEDGSDRVEA